LKNFFLFETFLILILGGLTSLSLPPFNYFIINFFTFSIFFIFLFKRLNKQISKKFFFYYGWLFGFGFFLTSLYWITISLTFDENLSFLIPITLFLVPFFLALFYGLVIFIFYLIRPKNILSAFFLFSLLFGIIDFIRGIILSGFPWNLIVYSLSKNLDFIGIISVIGTYSLNLIVISLYITPVFFILQRSRKQIIACIILLILPIIFIFYGTFQKEEFLNKELKKNPYIIRIIGSNISLERFYSGTQTENIINELIRISLPEEKKETFFVWPEGIIPNTYQDELDLFNDIIEENFSENHLIGLGITDRKISDNDYKYYNSFSIFDNNLNLVDSYNKINLVPFGEFLPFENIFNKIGLKPITNKIGSFSRGNKRKIISLENNNQKLKFLPLICYEIIYSGNLTKNFDFDFILNISEDGWFGKSIGPKQHFTHSVFRAIENGKYIIRSSNNGMAAIINPVGQIEKKIDYGKSGFIDFEKRRDHHQTIFSIYGNKIFIILILLYIFLIFSFNRIKNE